MNTCQGWSTSPDFDPQTGNTETICETCGNITTAAAPAAIAGPSNITATNVRASVGSVNGNNGNNPPATGPRASGPRFRLRAHNDLVRSVALNADFAVSGSYDTTVKVWLLSPISIVRAV